MFAVGSVFHSAAVRIWSAFEKLQGDVIPANGHFSSRAASLIQRILYQAKKVTTIRRRSRESGCSVMSSCLQIVYKCKANKVDEKSLPSLLSVVADAEYGDETGSLSEKLPRSSSRERWRREIATDTDQEKRMSKVETKSEKKVEQAGERKARHQEGGAGSVKASEREREIRE